MSILDEARAWQELGYTPLPLKLDGSKSPWVSDWETYQAEPATRDEVDAMFSIRSRAEGLGIVCGATSGNLEMLELEGRAVADGLLQDVVNILNDHDIGDLWQLIDHGYVEETPSGGIHWYFRVDGPAMGNTKIARRLGADGKVEVLIETRGEGGFTVVAPSAGSSHSTGRAWTVLRGAKESIPVIGSEQRDALYAILGLLNQMPVVDEPPERKQASVNLYGGVRPGDDFNTKATWDDILGKHGWAKVHQFKGQHIGWRRPGKNVGISATTGANEGDNLYVFSTSTQFEDLTPYSKFAAYTLLEHNGDWSAAAKALRAEGYGQEPHVPTTPVAVTSHQPQVVGNLATVTQLRPSAAATLGHTDDANAMLLVARFGEILRHCADRGRWYAWNGHVWAKCAQNGGVVREYAKQVARDLPENDPKDISHKRKTLSNVGISAMLRQAETDQRVAVDYGELDAHPWELNTPGGIVNLRTGELAPADPARLHTRTTSCAPDWDGDRTRWLQFLDETFGGDTDLIDYLQRLVGYSAVGIVHAHVLPYCHGNGGNGKGVFLEACVKVLGDYATTAPAGFLMAKTHVGHETEVARLAGARMVLCSEVNDEDRFDEARVKLLTGGDTLTARFMQQDHFTFEPTHQLWAMGNHKPHVRAGGRSFWRRLRLIPFLHEVPTDRIIDDLQGILASEDGPAILSWIIDGAVAYARDGLREPEAVKAATDEYATDQDTVTRFLDEMCHVGGGEHVQIKVGIIRNAYEAWCHETGDEPVSAKAFGLALRRAGITDKRTKQARMYVGLALVGDENASPGETDRTSEWFK